MPPAPPTLALESRTTFRWLTIAVVVGLAFTIAGLWTFGFVGIFTALLWAMACLVAGGAVGFLFGIPRVLQRDPPAPSDEASDEEDGGGYRMLVNTNLEQISDWLTKIIVGVGLIQLHELPGVLFEAATFVGTGLGADATVLAMALLSYFTVTGFLCGYLMTRLYLAGAFARADASVSVGGSELSLPDAVRQMAQLLPDLLGSDDAAPAPARPEPPPSPSAADETSEDDEETAEPEAGRDEEDALAETSPAPSPQLVTRGGDTLTFPPAATKMGRPMAKMAQRERAILWVDDNPTNNSFLVERLNRQGARVVTAQSTSEALDLFQRQAFHHIVTDMGRVEGRRYNQRAGLDLIRAIRTHDTAVPIAVYCSARGARVYSAEALEAGATLVTDNSQTLLHALETDRASRAS